MNVYVTSLFDMPHYVRTLEPSHLISVIQPEYQPSTPTEITVANHLRIQIHDISESTDGLIHPGEAHIRTLIEYLHDWQMDAPLLVHCYAGISRSTAAALIAHVIKKGDPESAAIALRKAAPHARPNTLMVALADDILGLGGRLIKAKQSMGEGVIGEDQGLVELSVA